MREGQVKIVFMAVSLNCGLNVDSSKVSDILQETKCLYSLLAVTFKHGPCKSLCCALASSLFNGRFLLWLQHCPI